MYKKVLYESNEYLQLRDEYFEWLNYSEKSLTMREYLAKYHGKIIVY
jgi:hypothetical protein